MKLYELTNQYLELEQKLQDEGIDIVCIQDTLESIEGEIEDKVDGIAKMIRNIEGDINAFKAEEERMYQRRTTLINRKESIKNYLASQMELLNREKVKTPLFTASFRTSKAVDIVDMTKIGTQYLTISTTINKSAISEDLKAGIKVEGAELKENKSLQIR